MYNINFLKILDNFSYFIFLLLPFTFIIGTAAVNIAIFFSIICLFSMSFVEKDWLWLKDKILIFFSVFVIYLIVNNLVFNNENISTEKLIKIVSYYRFIFFVFFISIFFKKLNEKRKIFFIKFNLLVILFVIIDIFIQLIFGKDVFGFTGGMCFGEYTHIDFKTFTKEQVLSNLCQRYAGPFDQEFIAGTFIVFMGTLFFSLNFLSLSLSKKKRLLFIISIILCFLTTLITGDRNPFISLIITLFIFFLIERNFRKDFFKFFSVLFIIGLFTTLLNVHLYERYVSAGRDLLSVPEKFDFFKDKKEKFESLQESNHLNNVEKNSYLSNFKKKFNNTQWGAHYLVSIEMFKKKPMTGYGYQSYRIECHKYDYIESSMANVRCSSHPHNYIIQLFSETGLIGFILYILFLMSIFYKLKDLKNNLNKPLAIFLGALLFSFLFPFKPSGSIFSSMNNSFLFYLIGWVVYSFNLTDIRVLRK